MAGKFLRKGALKELTFQYIVHQYFVSYLSLNSRACPTSKYNSEQFCPLPTHPCLFFFPWNNLLLIYRFTSIWNTQLLPFSLVKNERDWKISRNCCKRGDDSNGWSGNYILLFKSFGIFYSNMVLTSDHVDFNSTYTRLVNKQSLIPSPDEIPLRLCLLLRTSVTRTRPILRILALI